jgi:hypothetical protein
MSSGVLKLKSPPIDNIMAVKKSKLYGLCLSRIGCQLKITANGYGFMQVGNVLPSSPAY